MILRLDRTIVTVVFVLCVSAATPGQNVNVISTARAVDQHYNQLKSFSGAFTETYQGPGVSRSESGKVWLKKPGRMRWEYHAPKEKLFLTDSQNAYFYVPGERQARRTPLSKIDDIRSPLRYLLGKTKLEKELDLLSLAPDITPIHPGDVVLRGVPKGMKDRVSEVILEISPAHEIVRIVIQGVDEARTDFRFTNIEENVSLPDNLFRFDPPPGVAIITDNQVVQ